MIHTPPQHQTDPNKAPGQVKTLSDYIEQVNQQECPKKKLTFHEWFRWYEGSNPDAHLIGPELIAEIAWDAALENM
jgi:hypothetical protein